MGVGTKFERIKAGPVICKISVVRESTSYMEEATSARARQLKMRRPQVAPFYLFIIIYLFPSVHEPCS